MDYANTARNFLQATHLLLPNNYTYRHQIVPYQLSTIYPGELRITGYPRIDLTYQAMHNPLKLKSELSLKEDKPVIFYAPTWRGGVKNRAFDNQQLKKDLQRLNSLDVNIVFRGHQFVEEMLTNIELSNTTVVPSYFDTNEILGITDILITDYSSVFFDFLVTDRPIIHYVFDYEEYISERGLYFELEELPGTVAQSRTELITAVEAYLTEQSKPTKKYRQDKKKEVYEDDGHVTERVVDWFVFGNKILDVVKKPKVKEKILFNAGSFQPNGITQAFINLISHIDLEIYDITVVLSDKIINHPERLVLLDKIKDYVNIIPKNGAMIRSDMGIFALDLFNLNIANDKLFGVYQEEHKQEFKRLFGDVEFDYLIDYSGYSVYNSQLLVSDASKNSKKVIYAHNDMYCEYKEKYRYLEIIFEQYKQYDKVISVSKNVNKENINNLSERFSIPVSKFDYVKNIQNPRVVIEKSKLSLNNKEDEKLFTDDKIVFITIGRLSGEKNQETLIRAFAKIYKKHPEIRLIILGKGPLKYRLMAVIDELELEESVHLLGIKSNPYPYLKKADCFIFPSNYEGQGLVLYEALILNKPIIATDIVTSREILQDGYGELCCNSVDGLAQAMNRFLEGKLNFKTFDIDTYNRQALYSFYEKVL